MVVLTHQLLPWSPSPLSTSGISHREQGSGAPPSTRRPSWAEDQFQEHELPLLLSCVVSRPGMPPPECRGSLHSQRADLALR